MLGTKIGLLLQELIDYLDPPYGESPEFYADYEQKALKLIQANPRILKEQGGEEDNNVTPLIAAVMRGPRCCSVDLFKAMILGSNVDAANKFGNRVIHYLARNNRFEHLQVLLNAANEKKIKVDVNATTAVGDTAANLAALEGASEALGLLTIVGKVDVNIVNAQKQSPLHVACFFGQPQGGKRETPITQEQAQRYLECIDLLLLRGSEVNARDEFGSTPVHCLVSVDIPEELKTNALKLLIEHGADLTIKANNLNTPVAMAKGYQFHEFSEIVQQEVVPSLRILAAKKLLEAKAQETTLFEDIANILKRLKLGKGQK